ncbi:hypothetical protein H696_05494 [Fonticula alba]|uniref:EF-hand domain-containing protein n=1 Tax=Fonticula alba TaxID=691883 RepID=A0A058Z1N7_FONAL|nr:hypothetical protein H696_05494 [Fonticula alba]KCV68026.1 hypothetical protein H696_05494 [Fonticula alba]|eukprot:XP_009497593.1 hypothetical protein H696_05494 [Fonticula alba]
MGAHQSQLLANKEDQAASLDSLSRDVGLTNEELTRALIRFRRLDADGSGAVDHEEFAAVAGVSTNPLARRIIQVLDADGGGDVDFAEFARALKIFSTRGTHLERLEFMFRVYDVDRDGFISPGDLFRVLRTMVGDNLGPVQLQQLVDRAMISGDHDGDGLINFEDFQKLLNSSGAAPEVLDQMTLALL